MTPLERALRDFLALRPPGVAIAVIGGIAVSVRTVPRFTRDLDLAVAVVDDAEAEAYVLAMRARGYELTTALVQTARRRLSTVRMRRAGRGPMIDLLFAATGIEREIIAAAEPIEIARGITANVARTGHLIAMKLVARDDKRRPQDRVDLIALARAADKREWKRAAHAVELIQERGFARRRNLSALLKRLRSDLDD
jgi:nucleotidyltransferase AbiEii toxin of type IV toxin-antitoxin system